MKWFSNLFSCFKAQQSPQQQPEKTAPKKEDSSNPVNESEAALKTPSNGGGGAGKSWASLFKKDTPENLTGSTQNKPMARIQPYTNMGEDGNEDKKESKGNKDGGEYSKYSDSELQRSIISILFLYQNVQGTTNLSLESTTA